MLNVPFPLQSNAAFEVLKYGAKTSSRKTNIALKIIISLVPSFIGHIGHLMLKCNAPENAKNLTVYIMKLLRGKKGATEKHFWAFLQKNLNCETDSLSRMKANKMEQNRRKAISI